MTVWTEIEGCEARISRSVRALLPRRVVLLAFVGGRLGCIDLQDALMPKRGMLLHFQRKHGRVPPHDIWSIPQRLMEAGTHRSYCRRDALRPAIEHAVFPKGRAAVCGDTIGA